jgi:hypothetical protein
MPAYTDRRVSNTGVFNIEIVKGTDFLLIGRVQEKNQAFGSGGYEPIDVTGWSWTAKIRSADLGTLLATFDVQVADQGSDPGVFYLALSDDITTTLPVTSGVYDVIADANNTKRQVLRGTVKIEESVSAY